jgi:hypothetical protein
MEHAVCWDASARPQDLELCILEEGQKVNAHASIEQHPHSQLGDADANIEFQAQCNTAQTGGSDFVSAFCSLSLKPFTNVAPPDTMMLFHKFCSTHTPVVQSVLSPVQNPNPGQCRCKHEENPVTSVTNRVTGEEEEGGTYALDVNVALIEA